MAKGRKLKEKTKNLRETGNKNPVPESGRIDQTGETFTLFDSVQNRVMTDDALASSR